MFVYRQQLNTEGPCLAKSCHQFHKARTNEGHYQLCLAENRVTVTMREDNLHEKQCQDTALLTKNEDESASRDRASVVAVLQKSAIVIRDI